MEINRFDSVHKPAPAPQMSILGIIFFMMGAPNMYAFFQRRADNATYKGGGVPRYAFVVLLAIAIAGYIELSIVGAA